MFHNKPAVEQDTDDVAYTIENVGSLAYEKIGNLPYGKILRYTQSTNVYAVDASYGSSFITIKKENLPPTSREVSLPSDKGWKIHISVASAYIALAWDIIVDILIAHETNEFKVIRKDKIAALAANQQQDGKVVTLYCFKQNPQKTPEEWCNLITAITESLIRADIPPGRFPDDPDSPRQPDEPYNNGKEIRIPGTDYCSYRNDLGIRDKVPNPMIYSNGKHIQIDASSIPRLNPNL